MPRGASPKREKEYEHLKEKFEEEGRYKGREQEVAARIVNKQRSEYGETKEDKEKDREGKSSDRGLPIPDYEHLTVDEISGKLSDLSKKDLEKIKHYEESHKHRKTLMEELEKATTD